jgi:hypothetical protein
MEFQSVMSVNAPDEEENVSSGLNGLQIQQFCGRLYLWRAAHIEQDYPAKGKEALSLVLNKFITKFFSLSRGNIEGITALSNELISTLKRFLPNMNINELEIVDKLRNDFNKFHFEVTDLQQSISLELLVAIKKRYMFKNEVSSWLFSKKSLENEEQKFLTRMFELKSFTADLLTEEFLSILKDFIIGFDMLIEHEIKDRIRRKLPEFEHKVEFYITQSRSRIFEYINGILHTIRPMRLTIGMFQLCEDDSVPEKWELVHEQLLGLEEVSLSQVAKLSGTHVLLVLSLKATNKTLIISDKEMITKPVSELILGDDVIIADGSKENSLILLNNSAKTAFFGSIDNNQIIISRVFNVFTTPEPIHFASAGFLAKTNEILLLTHSKHMLKFTVPSESLTEFSLFNDLTASLISVSLCGRFVIVLTNEEIRVFSRDLRLVFMSREAPVFADVQSEEIVMVFMRHFEDVKIKRVRIATDEEMAKDDNYSLRVVTEVGKTFQLAKELFSGFFADRNFEKYNPPELEPAKGNFE